MSDREEHEVLVVDDLGREVLLVMDEPTYKQFAKSVGVHSSPTDALSGRTGSTSPRASRASSSE